MAFADWPAGLRWSAVRLPPLLVLLVAFVTLLTTGLVSKARNDPWGGLPAPYISDTAKTPPNWIVFAVGFTIAAALYDYVATAYALALRRRRGAEDAVTGRVALAAVVVAQPAVLGQALLAILNTQDFPTAHLAFALLFFIFVIVWIALDLVLTRRWERAEGAARPRLRRMFLYKAVVASLAFLAFILYIPVGLSVISSSCPWVWDPETDYYDYTNCTGLNEFRVGAQYASVAFIILYIAGMQHPDYMDGSWLPPLVEAAGSASAAASGKDTEPVEQA